MSDLDVQIPTTFDPFADANAEDSGAGAKEYVHIRIQQRNGRKSLTTVQGLKKEFSYNKILKDLKKEFCCNGTVVQDPELGQVIQLQGDQRKNVSTFLVQGWHCEEGEHQNPWFLSCSCLKFSAKSHGLCQSRKYYLIRIISMVLYHLYVSFITTYASRISCAF
ncbi:Translation initiation factor SUI1 family protein, putative [Theobroma cacao]|uniref:Translation initiation factor SUI1 family protein, putative n=1 Tax=Theobroma cacao TaxID=3641 RepID=A0A061F6N8_THECC|nr:Translation initiation factor SUI1 family protein, putative [Theobroma cacao]